jgi:chaperone modulatory protein CbpM
MMVSTNLIQMTVSELCECEGVSSTVVVQLVENDIAHPVMGKQVEDWVFDSNGVIWVKKAIRLHRDLELDWLAVATLIDLLRDRDRLARENRALKLRLQRFLGEG